MHYARPVEIYVVKHICSEVCFRLLGLPIEETMPELKLLQETSNVPNATCLWIRLVEQIVAAVCAECIHSCHSRVPIALKGLLFQSVLKQSCPTPYHITNRILDSGLGYVTTTVESS